MATILVIDDDELILRTVKAILVKAGHEVVEASNGKKGLAALQTCTIDLVITDIIMPEQEGIETIIEIRRHAPKIRIIAISGGGRSRNFDFLDIAHKLGADHVLPKPFRSAALLEMVDLSLNGTTG